MINAFSFAQECWFRTLEIRCFNEYSNYFEIIAVVFILAQFCDGLKSKSILTSIKHMSLS